MSSPSSHNEEYSWATQADIDSFIKHLNKSKRILALCGAGLSAPSGIPTYRGSGAYWNGHKATSISSIDTFKVNPGLVWKYFTDRRRLVLKAKPNRGHVSLAKTAQKKPGFVCLTQNIDGDVTDSIFFT
jgi:NAD-dependent SIR2 family protein deacetylase